MNTPRPVVRVVDDDASWLTAMARMLHASGFMVKTFPSAAEFLAHPEPQVPGCLVLDVKMPALSGLDLQDALAKAGSPLPIVFVTGHGEIPDSVRAMRHGAEDFLTKRATKEAMIDAVRRALARDAEERAGHERLRQLRARIDNLSDRERQVLEHVIHGQLNKQIAADLGIHERTVKLHRTAITAKLGVHSVAELTRLWIEANNCP